MKDYLMTLRTTRVRLGAIIMVMSLVISACSGGAAKATEVKITAPAAGTTINVGQGTVIQGEANGDNITRVEVVVDGKAYASLSTPDKTKGVANFPVNLPWTPMSAGTHAIQLRAYGIDDKPLGQSEPLVLDAKATVAQVTPTATKGTAAATATPSAQTTVTATVAPQATSASDGPSMTVTNDFVNVREGPAIGYKLLGSLDKGKSAPVRGKSSDGKWWQISYAAGTNGVGWVFGEYVQANAAANNVSVGSAPPLPTSAPQPVSLPTYAAPTALPATAIVVQSQPLVGSQGQLHVDVNPVASGGTVTAYWNVSGISGIWFDKGDGNGFQAAVGAQSVAVGGLTAQRTLQLKWQNSSGAYTTDVLTVYISGQTVSVTSTASSTCTSSDANWRGANPNYPFCVISDMDWVGGAPSVRYEDKTDKTIGVQWNIYGISGIWVSVQPNGQQCGAASSGGFEVAVPGNGSYSWNVKDMHGGYIVHMKILRNDGAYTYYNEKFLNVGSCKPSSGATNTPVPPTAVPPTSVPPTAVPPTTEPTAAP